jgi:hypothetical protein
MNKKELRKNLIVLIGTREYLSKWYTERSKLYKVAAKYHRARPVKLDTLVFTKQKLGDLNNRIRSCRRQLAR